MDREMGYRNMLAVEELASQGKLTVTHKGARSFDFAQYALLSRMAWLTADWPLDKAAKEKHMLPRTYASGWLAEPPASPLVTRDTCDGARR